MYQLTKSDVDAIKKCDSIGFKLVHNMPPKIFCHKKIKDKTFGRSNSDLTYEIELQTDDCNIGTGCQAYAGINYIDSHGEIQALRYILKVGDRIVLACRNNQNQYIEAASIEAGKLDGHYAGYPKLFHDELLISIYRKNKTVIYAMVIDSSTCPNNSARMLKCSQGDGLNLNSF